MSMRVVLIAAGLTGALLQRPVFCADELLRSGDMEEAFRDGMAAGWGQELLWFQ